jgi:hypothetical protein
MARVNDTAVPARRRRSVVAYEVTIERTTECPTAVVKANTTWREFHALWPTLLDEVWAFLGRTPGLRNEGHNVMLYRNDVPEVEVVVEVGVQVTKPFWAAGRVVPSTLPAAEVAATFTPERPQRSARRTMRFGHGALRSAAS